MAITQGRTRLQLRQAIAPHVGAYVSSASETVDTASLVDNTLSMGAASDNAQKGKWIDFTSGTNNSGLVRQVLSSTAASNKTDMTVVAVTDTITSGDTYILWPQWLPPNNVNRILDNAIMALSSRYYDPEESLAWHGDGVTGRFDLSSEFAMVKEVQYRWSVDSKDIDLCNTVWGTVDADVTASVDDEDYKEGGASLKLVVAAGAEAGDILAQTTISSLDLSGYDYVEFWAKTTVATLVGALILHLNTGTISDAVASTDEMNVPALAANTWTFCRVALSNPSLDTAIVRVGLELNTDATSTVWIDGIRAVKNDSGRWAELPRQCWGIDKEAADLVLTGEGVAIVGSRLMKVVGGDEPALFSADSSTTEVPERYMIAYAVYHLLLSCKDDFLRKNIPVWKEEMERARKALPPLIGVREVG